MKGRVLRLVVLAVVAALLPACHVTRPADPNRRATAALPASEAWPDRDLQAVRRFHERTPDEIYAYELSGLVPREALDEDARIALATPSRTVLANRLTAHGLLRVWTLNEHDTLYRGLWFGEAFRANASFLSSRFASGYQLERATRDLPDVIGGPRNTRDFGAPHGGLQRSYAAGSILLTEGIEMHIPPRVSGRGLLVVLGGLLSTVWQEESIELFAGAGWDILQIDSRTGVRGPNDDAVRRAQDAQMASLIDRLTADRDAADDEQGETPTERSARIRKRAPEETLALYDAIMSAHPTPPSGLEYTRETDPTELGRVIARAIDDGIAENAYAAEAGVRYLIETHGRDAIGPIAVLGYSAGSLSSPGVAARLRGGGIDLAAMILIGSGADLLDVSRRSELGGTTLSLRGPDGFEPTAEQVERVRDAYRDRVELDPYTLGPALADIPTLLMIASDDRLVPNGDLLDERLGYPDRIRYFGGHGGLFYFLPQQTPRMIRWLDEAVSAR